MLLVRKKGGRFKMVSKKDILNICKKRGKTEAERKLCHYLSTGSKKVPIRGKGMGRGLKVKL